MSRNRSLTDAASQFPDRLALLTASDLMTPNPVTIMITATVPEAVAVLTDLHFSGAPVVDADGCPVGVISRTDIVRNNHEEVDRIQPSSEPDETDLWRTLVESRDDFLIEKVNETRVEDIMTPLVFSVKPNCGGVDIVTKMLSQDVHRILVVDDEGTLQGVISSMDILRELVDSTRSRTAQDT